MTPATLSSPLRLTQQNLRKEQDPHQGSYQVLLHQIIDLVLEPHPTPNFVLKRNLLHNWKTAEKRIPVLYSIYKVPAILLCVCSVLWCRYNWIESASLINPLSPCITGMSLSTSTSAALLPCHQAGWLLCQLVSWAVWWTARLNKGVSTGK